MANGRAECGKSEGAREAGRRGEGGREGGEALYKGGGREAAVAALGGAGALVVGPDGLADPAEAEAGVGAYLDGGGLGGADGVLHALHEVLGVEDELLHRLLVLLAP